MKKITTPQLLEALVEQRETGRKLGEILVRRRMVAQPDVDAALRSQGVNPLQDTKGGPEGTGLYWDQSDPETILDYLLALGARKRASDFSLEPQADQIAVRYRIDGFSFRVDPIPKQFEVALQRQIFGMFGLDPARRGRPQAGRAVARLMDADYDLVLQTVPGTSGLAVQVKLINRTTFVKDFTTLGLELEDRVTLLEEMRSGLGLLLVASPAFNGAITTWYAIMSFLARGQRDVLAIESPIHHPLEGVRQVEAEAGPDGPHIEATLRAMVAVRPDVLMLSTVPDHGTALLAAQLASSLMVVGTATAPSAARGIVGLRDFGVPPPLLAGSLALVVGQRLVRTVCRICRVPAEPPAPKTLAAHGIDADEARGLQFFKGKGCPTCNTVGYRGRQAVFELLPASPDVRQALEQGLPAKDVEQAAVASGMTPLRARCLALVRQGITTFDEFARLRF
jgi:type IV pilus assembly protein PilB